MTDPPALDPNPLAELLRRAGEGEAAALEELLRRYEPLVRISARALLSAPLRRVLDSFDLVQSVHRALLPGFRGGKYTVANEAQLVGLAVAVLRHKVRRAAWRNRPRPADQLVRREVAAAHSPSAAADAQELADTLFQGLDATDRRIVELRSQDYGTAEIAVELGFSPEAVRTRLCRLRKRLRDAGHDRE